MVTLIVNKPFQCEKMKKNLYNRQSTGHSPVGQAITQNQRIPTHSAKSLLADNVLIVEALKKHPDLINESNDVREIYFPQWKHFRIFHINELFLLYDSNTLVFFNKSIETVKWELIDRHYFYEQEQKNNQAKKPGSSLDGAQKAYSNE